MFRDKLKNILGKEETQGNDKKKIENLVFFVIILIITIVIINVIWNGNKQQNKQETTNSTSKQLADAMTKTDALTGNREVQTTNELEKKLENILANIQGVGEVIV